MTYLLAKLTEWGLSALSWIVLQVQKYWMQILVVVGIVTLVATISLYFRKKPLKIDEAAIQKINSQNRAERTKELQNIVEDNADAIETVNGNNTIAETNAVERNRVVDERVADANKKIEAAKQQGKDVTAEQLECILRGECQ